MRAARAQLTVWPPTEPKKDRKKHHARVYVVTDQQNDTEDQKIKVSACAQGLSAASWSAVSGLIYSGCGVT